MYKGPSTERLSWGRPHPNAEQMLHRLAKRTARRDGGGHQRAVLTRLRARLATEAMRRAAKMLLRCLPRCRRSQDGSPAEADDSAHSPQARLRPGHPALCQLPPLFPCSAAGSKLLWAWRESMARLLAK